jgi:predicted phosphodiesterase
MITWTNEMFNELRLLRAADPPHSYPSIAIIFTEKYGTVFSEEQIRSADRRWVRKERYAELRKDFPVSPKDRSFADPLSLTLDNLTVVADLHAPYHSPYMLQRMLDRSLAHGSETLIIAGDLYNFDSVSPWPSQGQVDSFREEIEVAGDVLLTLSHYFSAIYVCNGNHDERLSRRAAADIGLNELVTLSLDREVPSCPIYTTEYDYIRVQTASQPWVIGHLSSFSRRPGEAARRIAERYQANVAVGHDHIQGYTSTSEGAFLCVSVGSMIDIDDQGRSSLWYKERRLTDFMPVQNGFMIIENGVPWLYNKDGLSSLNGGLPWSALQPLD